MTIERRLAALIERRAAARCEYCRMHQSLQGATFHIEHIVPRSRGGETVLENLAWACPTCNLHKSDRIDIPDPQTGQIVALFNPRTERWNDHFRWEDRFLVPLTAVDRATVAVLELNHPRRIRIRRAEEIFGLFPPNE